MPRVAAVAAVVVATGLLGLVACGDDGLPEPDACLPALSRDCEIVWADFDAIYENRFARCGAVDTAGGCHSAEGAMGGLIMSDADTAHDALLGGLDGRARVIPGDPECSLLMQRIESTDPTFKMPPGADSLTEVQRCSIMKWIDEGADRQ